MCRGVSPAFFRDTRDWVSAVVSLCVHGHDRFRVFQSLPFVVEYWCCCSSALSYDFSLSSVFGCCVSYSEGPLCTGAAVAVPNRTMFCCEVLLYGWVLLFVGVANCGAKGIGTERQERSTSVDKRCSSCLSFLAPGMRADVRGRSAPGQDPRSHGGVARSGVLLGGGIGPVLQCFRSSRQVTNERPHTPSCSPFASATAVGGGYSESD